MLPDHDNASLLMALCDDESFSSIQNPYSHAVLTKVTTDFLDKNED
jgi:hypothetical protein